MKKTLYCLLLTLLPLLAAAQEATHQPPRFAWFSHDEVLRAMPEYKEAGRNIDSLQAEYAREAKRSADDFTQKYEEFLDQQRTLAPSIRRKRQAELQELMSQNIAFKAEGERLVERARQKAYEPARQRLRKAVAAIAAKRGYAFVINSDGDNLPYADPTQGDDITQELKRELGIR